MHWTLDIDTRKLTNPLDGIGVRSVGLAFPDKYPVTLDVVRSGVPYSFTGSVVLVLRPLMGQGAGELAKGTFEVTAAALAEGVFSLSTNPLDEWLPAFGDRPAVLEVLVVEEGSSEVASQPVRAVVSRRFGGLTGTPEDLAGDLASVGIEVS
jgi:hypothetical protein